MPKFGINMLLWTSSVDESMFPVIDQIKDWGYDGVEIPVFRVNDSGNRQTSRHLDELGLARTTSTMCTAGQNLASLDASIRRNGIEWLKRVVDATAALGAHLVCGPVHSALGEFTGHGPTSDEFRWAQQSLFEVGEHARTRDVMLALEAVNRFECYLVNCMADCARFVKEINHSHVGVMYDTFHANIEEKDTAGAIRACGDKLAHVHVSENDRSTPGQGAVDWSTTFRTLRGVNYDGWLMIEAFGQVLPELAAATKIWRKMYDSEEQLARDGLRFMRESWEKGSDQ